MSAFTMENFAAKLQELVSGTAAASPQISLGSAVELVRLINSKEVDMSTSVPTLAGGQITFGEILASRTEGVTRRNGTVGTDYVRVHELSQDTAKQWIPELKKLPAKEKSSFAGKGKKNNSQPKAENGLTAELLMAALQAMMAGQQPTAAENHTVAASPQTVEEIAAATAISVNVGDVLEIGGKLVQIVERANGSFGLNKTIV